MGRIELENRIIDVANSSLPAILKAQRLKISARTILSQTISCFYGEKGAEIFKSCKDISEFVKHIPYDQLIRFDDAISGIAHTIDTADFAGRYDYSILNINSEYSTVKDHTSYHKSLYKADHNRTMYQDFVMYQKEMPKEDKKEIDLGNDGMTKEEIMQKIKDDCAGIDKRLREFDDATIKYSDDNNFTIHTISAEYKGVLNQVVRALYNSSVQAITLSYRLKGSYKITDLIPDDQLYYCEALLATTKKYLERETVFDKKKLFEAINIAGKELQEDYKKKNNKTLLQRMDELNSEATFKNQVVERLNYCLNEADEEEIDLGIPYYKDKFKSVLPAKYEDVKFYGTILGTYTIAFYNMNRSELFAFLRKNGVKFSASKLEDIVPMEQCRYLYAMLSTLDEVYTRFNKEDAEALLEKTIFIGRILRDEFDKTHNAEAAIEVLKYMRGDQGMLEDIEKPQTRKRYRFEKKEDAAKASIYEQAMLLGFDDEDK